MAKPIRQRGKWRIRWLDETGRRRSAVYSEFRTATQELKRRELESAEVKAGLRAPIPQTRTFDELCNDWLKHRTPRKRSAKDDQSLIRVHLRPAFGVLPVRAISVARVDEFVATKAALSPKTVANILTLLIALLNYAKDLGWLDRVPRIRKPRVQLNQHEFSYLRTADEIRQFLDAAHKEGDMVFTLYASAIFTGMRAGELADLTWDRVDFERRLITVQGSFGGPTKGGDVRYVPIVDALLPILRVWRLKNPLRVVFPNRNGTRHGPSARVFQEVLHRVLDRCEFPKVRRNGRERRHVVFHDLRHTFASHWVLGGGDIFRLQRVLGHKSITMTLRYAHLAPDAFSEDHGRFAKVTEGAEILQFQSSSVAL